MIYAIKECSKHSSFIEATNHTDVIPARTIGKWLFSYIWFGKKAWFTYLKNILMRELDNKTSTFFIAFNSHLAELQFLYIIIMTKIVCCLSSSSFAIAKNTKTYPAPNIIIQFFVHSDSYSYTLSSTQPSSLLSTSTNCRIFS
jgi:hypothetical protein